MGVLEIEQAIARLSEDEMAELTAWLNQHHAALRQQQEPVSVAIQRGEQAIQEGRERPLAYFLAEQRVKHGFPVEWPHTPDDTQEPDDAA